MSCSVIACAISPLVLAAWAPSLRASHFQNDASKDTEDMNPQSCKRTLQIIFAELANGNGQPFVEAMHENSLAERVLAPPL